MGRVFMVDLQGNIYICKHCMTHLSRDQDIISKELAHVKNQGYREGKYVLELCKISSPHGINDLISDVDDA